MITMQDLLDMACRSRARQVTTDQPVTLVDTIDPCARYESILFGIFLRVDENGAIQKTKTKKGE